MKKPSTFDDLPSAELVITPDIEYTPYKNGMMGITVTMTMETLEGGTKVPIPSNATVSISLDNGYVIWPTRLPVPITPDDEDSSTGKALFLVVVHDAAKAEGTVTVSAVAEGVDAQRASVRYTTLDSADVNYVDPSRVVAKTAEPRRADEIIQFTVKVFQADQETPAVGYLVNWMQVWDTALFDAVKAYGSQHALDIDAPLKIYYRASNNKEGFVLSETDANGEAHLFLKPTEQPVFFQLRTTADIRSPNTFQPVIIYGPQANFDTTEPDVYAAPDRHLDLDKVTTVGVDAAIEVPDVSSDSMYLYVFIANNVVAGSRIFLPGELLNEQIVMSFSKQLVNITDSKNGNTVFYVVGERHSGSARSLPYMFSASGNKGDNTFPDEGNLDPPSVKYAGTYVNWNTIDHGLTVVVPFGSEPNLMRPEKHDKLTVTVLLNGWDRNGNERHNSPSQLITYDQDAAGDSVEVNFVRALVSDYGPRPSDGYYDHLYVQYVLTKPDSTIYKSKIADYRLSTIPIGQRSETE